MKLEWHRQATKTEYIGWAGCLGETEIYMICKLRRTKGNPTTYWRLNLRGESHRVSEVEFGIEAIKRLKEFAEKDFEDNILPDLMRVVKIHLDDKPVNGGSLKIAVLT